MHTPWHAMRFTGNNHFGLCHDAFDTDELAAIRRDVLASPHLGGSRLFPGTRGFSLVFTRAGMPRVRDELPFLGAFIDRALRPSCNAFYLNPLVMPRGAAVGSHVDCTLSPYLGREVTPVMVGVLYVDVPGDLSGGELVIWDGEHQVGRIPPRAGTLLYFGGRLRHAVTAVETETTRMSVVCEQYKLDDTALARIPTFELQPGFGYDRSWEYEFAAKLLHDLAHWRTDLGAGRRSLVLARVFGDRVPDASSDPVLVAHLIYDGGHADQVLDQAIAVLDRAAPLPASSPQAAAIAELRIRCGAARAEVAAIVARQRRPLIALPGVAGDPWLALAHDAASHVVQQWRDGFEDLCHRCEFPTAIASGDVFQRALVADALCDLPWLPALAPLLATELEYLHGSRVCPQRGWSYYPGFAELPPDADTLAQVIQVTQRLGRVDLLPSFEAPIDNAVHAGAVSDGSFATWIIPPAGERTPLHERQAALVGWLTPDPEVVANLTYALACLDAARFATEIAAAARWVAAQQRANGAWTAKWYIGTCYATYACVRALAHVGVAPAAQAAAFDRWITTQHDDGSWGRDGEPGNALDTALAMLGLATLDKTRAGAALARGRAYLATIAGDWPAVPFIRQHDADPGPFASRTLTAAYVAKAAVRCRP